jgi:pantetheine-phosphate adenylyltransferase
MTPPDDHDGSPAGAGRPAGTSRDGRTAATPRLAVYPGSFDPLTNGHVDIITRGSRLFDRIVVAVLVNDQKTPLFSADERVAMIAEVFRDQPAVDVETFDGLLVDYAARRGAHAIVRGLRAVSDFEYEFQMALMNRRLAGGLETVFMMPAAEYTYISSRLVKEVFMLGGTVEGLVPPLVEARLLEKRSARDRLASRREPGSTQ